jgi:hypothetical protein
MAEKIAIDFPRMTRDQATELFVYHCRMACALFEATPEDNNESVEAVLNEVFDEFDVEYKEATKVFARELLHYHNRLKDKD